MRWSRSFRLAGPLAARATSSGGPNATAGPNPFQNELTVTLALTRPQAVALELRDALSRVVLARPATPQAAGSNITQRATQSLPAGMYTLRLLPADGAAQGLEMLRNQHPLIIYDFQCINYCYPYWPPR